MNTVFVTLFAVLVLNSHVVTAGFADVQQQLLSFKPRTIPVIQHYEEFTKAGTLRKLFESETIKHRYTHKHPDTGVNLFGINVEAKLGDNHFPLAFDASILHTHCENGSLILVFNQTADIVPPQEEISRKNASELVMEFFKSDLERPLVSGVCDNLQESIGPKPYYREILGGGIQVPVARYLYQGSHVVAVEFSTIDVSPKALFDKLSLKVRWRPESRSKHDAQSSAPNYETNNVENNSGYIRRETRRFPAEDSNTHQVPRTLLDASMLTNLGGFAPECDTYGNRRLQSVSTEYESRNLAFWDDVGNAWDSLWDEVSGAVDDVGDEISDAIDGVGEEISDAIDDVVSKTGDFVDDTVDKISDSLDAVSDQVAEFSASTPQKVKAYWEEVFEEVKGKFDDHVLEPLKVGKAGIECKLKPNLNINFNETTMSAIESTIRFSDPDVPENVKEWVTCNDCYLYAGVEAHIDLDFGAFGVPDRFEAGIYAASSGNLKLHVNGPQKGLLKYFDESGPKKLATFQFAIGPVIVWVSLLVGLHGAIASSLESSDHLEFDAGMHFQGSFSAKAFWTSSSGWHTDTKEIMQVDYWLPDWQLSGEANGNLQGAMGPDIILEIWDTVPVVFKPKPKVNTAFGASTSEHGDEGNGPDAEPDTLCRNGDIYKLEWEMAMGIGVANVVIPSTIPVIGGHTLFGGHDFGEVQLTERTGFPDCGALCAGCYSSYVDNQEKFLKEATLHSMDLKQSIALGRSAMLSTPVIVLISLASIFAGLYVVLLITWWYFPGKWFALQEISPFFTEQIFCTRCIQYCLHCKDTNAIPPRGMMPHLKQAPDANVSNEGKVSVMWNKYYQHNNSSPTERKVQKLSPSRLKPFSGS